VEMATLHAAGKNLTQLIEKLQQPFESQEYRYSILEADFVSYGTKVLEELQAQIAAHAGWEMVTPNFEGIRVRCTADNQQGWFLLRMSLHDPVMPLNIESEIEGGVNNIAAELKTILDHFKSLQLK